MSLEQAVADYLTEAGKNQAFVAALQAKALEQIGLIGQAFQQRAALAELTRYVSASGSDTLNSGLTAQSPYKTIGKAVSDGVVGGTVNVLLMTDIVLTEHVRIYSRIVRLRSADNVRRNIGFGTYISTAVNDGSPHRALYRFTMEGDAVLTASGLRMNMPNVPPALAGVQSIWGYPTCMVSRPDQGAETIFARLAVAFLGVHFDIGDSPMGAITDNLLTSLYVDQAVGTNNTLAGHWIPFVTATGGTPATSIPSILTNLPNL